MTTSKLGNISDLIYTAALDYVRKEKHMATPNAKQKRKYRTTPEHFAIQPEHSVWDAYQVGNESKSHGAGEFGVYGYRIFAYSLTEAIVAADYMLKRAIPPRDGEGWTE